MERSLLSFAGQSDDVNNQVIKNTSRIKIWTFCSDDKVEPNTINKDCVIEKLSVFQINLGLTYGLDKVTKQNVPINAYSITTGLIAGFKWMPSMISVIKSENNKGFNCYVNGTLEWKLFGMTIYSQPKALSGFIETK